MVDTSGHLTRFLEMHMYVTSALQKTDMKSVFLQMAMDLLHKKVVFQISQHWRSEEEFVTLFTGKSRPGHWTEVADECRPAQLEQGLDELQNNLYLTQFQLCHLVLQCSFKGVCKDKRTKGWKGKNFLRQNLSVLPFQYNQFQLLSAWLLVFDCSILKTPERSENLPPRSRFSSVATQLWARCWRPSATSLVSRSGFRLNRFYGYFSKIA